MAVVFVLVARKDHGHVKAVKDASKAGDGGGGNGMAGEKCDLGPTCLLLYVLLFRFTNTIRR